VPKSKKSLGPADTVK